MFNLHIEAWYVILQPVMEQLNEYQLFSGLNVVICKINKL